MQENIEHKPGVYQIRNLINGIVYIGSAVDLYQRMHGHFSNLRNKKHHTVKLQRSWNKYGEENFVFEILEIVERRVGETNIEFERRLCKEQEQSYLDKYGAQQFIYKESYEFIKRTYNTCPTAGSSLGRVLENYVAWNKGKSHTQEQKNNLSKAWDRRRINHPTKDSTRQQMSKSISEARQKPEVQEKYQQAILNRPLITCPHCNYSSYNKGNMTKCHFDRCIKNPNFDHEAEKIRKELLSIKLKAAKPNLPIVKCPHCNKESQNKGNMIQNHFNNCKLNKNS